jgi:hypothetical protein
MGSIFDVLFQSLGSIFGLEWRDRREHKRQLAGQVVCGLRVIAGSEQGLGSGWRVRRAMVHPGRLEFAKRTPTSVQVRAVVTERQRHMRWRESRLILDTTWQIVELMTDSATLEWALPEDKLEWAVARVRGSEVPSV